MVKTDSVGDTLWTKTYYNPKESSAFSVQQTTDGGYIIAGSFISNSSGNSYDLLLMKINAVGDTLWTRRYGGNGPDYGSFVRQTKDGGYIISGTSASYGGVYIIKTDSMGNVASSTGVAEINNPLKFEIYPNPSNGNFNIELKGVSQHNSSIEIYNLNAEKVYSSKVKNNSTLHLNIPNLISGMYLVLLRTDNKIFSSKLIIQK